MAEPGCHLWGRTESDTTEVTQQQQQQQQSFFYLENIWNSLCGVEVTYNIHAFVLNVTELLLISGYYALYYSPSVSEKCL